MNETPADGHTHDTHTCVDCELAAAMHKLFVSLQHAGFSERQAIQLVAAVSGGAR